MKNLELTDIMGQLAVFKVKCDRLMITPRIMIQDRTIGEGNEKAATNIYLKIENGIGTIIIQS